MRRRLSICGFFRWTFTCMTLALLVAWIGSCWTLVSLVRFAPASPSVMSEGLISSGWETQAQGGAGRFFVSWGGRPGPPVLKRNVNWLFGYEGFWTWWFGYSRHAF